MIKNSSIDDHENKMKNRVAGHAVLEEDITRMINHIKTFETDDGFPCVHRRPRRYFKEEGLTYKIIHSRYEALMKTIPARVLSYSRWLQYFHLKFPGVRLTRSIEDVCDLCARIKIQLKDHESDPEIKTSLE